MMTAVENVAGALLIEMFIAVMLYGITTTQAYVYWWNYPDDSKLTKRTVLAVWLLETIHTAFCLDMIYNYVIIDFGNLARIEKIIWSVGATVITAVLIAAIVQSFFIRRIWILSQGNIVITSIPTVLLTCRVGLGFATASLTWTIREWPGFRKSIGPLFTLTFGLSLAATVDFIIAASLIYYLQKSRAGSRRTDSLIRSLQAYVINTGLLTMLVSIAILLTFLLYKTSLLFTGLVEIQSKLYANSFLATLNARQHLNELRSRHTDEAISMSFAARVPTTQAHSIPPRHIEIYQSVMKDTDVLGDNLPPNATIASSMDVIGEEGKDSRKVQVLV